MKSSCEYTFTSCSPVDVVKTLHGLSDVWEDGPVVKIRSTFDNSEVPLYRRKLYTSDVYEITTRGFAYMITEQLGPDSSFRREGGIVLIFNRGVLYAILEKTQDNDIKMHIQ